jgi:hypothetical protein
MSSSEGTLELLTRELGCALQPLEDMLAQGQVLTLFAELGLSLPDELLGNAAFTNALAEAVGAAAALPGLISDLVTAAEDEDTLAIAEAVAAIITEVTTIVTKLDMVAQELDNLASTLAGVDAMDLAAFAGEFVDRLVQYLLIVHMEGHYPILLQFLALFGVVELQAVTGDPADATKPAYIKRRLHLDQFENLLQPGDAFRSLYKWGEAGFDAKLLLERLRDLLLDMAVPVSLDVPTDPAAAAKLELFWLRLQENKATTPPGLRANLVASLPAGLELSVPIFSEGWSVDIASEFLAEAETAIIVEPPAELEIIPPSGSVEGRVSLSLVGTPPEPAEAFLLLEFTGIGRLEVTGFRAGFVTQFSVDSASGGFTSALGFEAEVDRARLLVGTDETDGFLSQMLPDGGLESEFELLIGVATDTGIYFEGSATLEIQIPTHISLGPVELVSMTIEVPVGGGELPVQLGTNVKAELGPLQATVKGLGLTANFSFPGGMDGNLGPVNLKPGFKWPTGVGLAIDAQAVKGGGFLDIDRPNNRYVGILQLEIQEIIDVTAVGLITTKLPGGKEGFSLLILISAEFQPIQLGMGFTLNGVGGLLGLHRTMVIDVLREGVRDNSLKSVLFPEDPVANAMQIISDLRAAFPPHEGQFVIGPMAKIGYGTPSIITLELGLVIELSDPVRVAILGVLKAILPEEESALIKIQVNFLGTIDFEAGKFTFDASLFDSRLLVFDLSGDMAVRLFWKGDPQFLLSVGGFHPSFEPPPLDLPAMRRLALQLSDGGNPRLRLETYFAITSNTVQFGAKLELYAAAGPFNAYGFLAFDVLFQFSPFYFIASIGAMLALRAGSSTLASISLSLSLEGPTPWKAKGTAKLKLFWFLTVKVRFSTTWGDRRDTLLEDVAVLDRVVEALTDKKNWQSALPNQRNLLVSLKEIAPIEDEVVVHPFGGLNIGQKVVPLNVTIDKFGNAKPSDFNEFSITNHRAGGAPIASTDIHNTKDHFAPAQFFEKSDAEKLSADSFVKFDAGFALGTSEQLESSHYVKREVTYELHYIDSQRAPRVLFFAGLFAPVATMFNLFTRNRAVARSPLSFAAKRKSALAPEAVQVNQEGYAVANISNLKVAADSEVMATEAEALVLMQRLQREQPALAGMLQVVPSFELNRDLAA